ncbi:MAG: hypothetical protein ABEN55_00445 [Bradymonadaceae bacterium]
MTDPKRQPWKRRDDETDAAWQAFRIYRDLGPARNFQKAWEKYADERGLKTEEPHGKFWEWVREKSWEKRVKAYEAHKDEMRLARHREKRREAQDELMKQVVNVVRRLIVTALGPEALEQIEGMSEMPDGVQYDAMLEVLDRGGVDAADKLEITGDITQRSKREGLDLELFADFLEMDEEDRSERIKALERMRSQIDGGDDDDA